jgi:hypothetical protein
MLAPYGLGGGIGFVLLAGLGLLAAPATAGGPISVSNACQEQHGWSSVAEHDGDGEFDWYCLDFITLDVQGVDLDEYCTVTYGGGSSATNNGGGIYDWSCT